MTAVVEAEHSGLSRGHHTSGYQVRELRCGLLRHRRRRRVADRFPKMLLAMVAYPRSVCSISMEPFEITILRGSQVSYISTVSSPMSSSRLPTE